MEEKAQRNKEIGAKVFSALHGDRMRDNGQKLKPRKYHLNLLAGGGMSLDKHRLPREAVKSPSLAIFNQI